MRAKIFIDCSGDGDLAAWAGAPFEVGDNAGSMLYPSMMFRLNGIDPDRADPVFTFSVILISLGVGFIASSGLSWLMSRKLGLLTPAISPTPTEE